MTSYILEKTFTTSDGTRLFYRHSDLSYPRRVIVLHGLTEHSGSYVPLMQRVFPKGDVSWVALDLHGHGHSEGERNEIETHNYITGIKSLIKHLGWAEGSYIGICHSFGSLLALHLTLKQPHYFKALILSAPFLATPDCGSWVEGITYLICSILFPKARFYDQIVYRRLTHDKELIKYYQNDALITRHLSLDAIRKTEQMQLEVRELNKVEIPVLVLTGDKDMIVSLRAIRRWLTNCQGEKLEKRFFKGLYHEVFKESPNENVISEVQSFIAKYGL